jgi:CO/xanthine dehydrogenase FAD-binding subunit
MTFHRPSLLDEALALKAATSLKILAGGTDFYPSLRDQPVAFPVLDITAIKELRHIRRDGHYWSIGANATWSDIQNAALPAAFDGLKLAAREVGSKQIQNRATIAGNLCNASPAADGVPPLLTLNAEVEIASIEATRRLPLSQFINGNRKIALARDEIVTRILVHDTFAQGNSSFLKLGARKYLVISIAMASARIVLQDDRIEQAAIAVGSCSEVAQRLPQVEALVIGRNTSEIKTLRIDPDSLSELAPIDDVRATAIYRVEAASTLIRNAIFAALP